MSKWPDCNDSFIAWGFFIFSACPVKVATYHHPAMPLRAGRNQLDKVEVFC